MTASIKGAFFDGLPMQARTDWGAVERLDERLAALVADAEGFWPGLSVNPSEYIRHVAARCGEGKPPDPTFQQLNTKDLYLAAACLKGDTSALALFEQHYLRQIPVMLASMQIKPDFVEEVQQQLRFRILTASSEKQPALAQYRGRGALLGWVRIMAVRTALNLLDRAENRNRSELTEQNAEAQNKDGSRKDAERLLVEERYRETAREAFLTALTSLPTKARTLLRLHYVDGLTLEAIGKIYATHKSTISRWLEQARNAIRDELRSVLRERLGLSASEADSLVDTLTSQLELSLSDVLRDPP